MNIRYEGIWDHVGEKSPNFIKKEVIHLDILRGLTYNEHKDLIDTSYGNSAPDVIFEDVNVFNINTGTVEKKNVFIKEKRIAYVGTNKPLISEKMKTIKLKNNQILVPGYIEPHAHPNQMYNPYTYGKYLTSKGTTVSVNDNLTVFSNMDKIKVKEFIRFLDGTKEHLWLWSAYFEGESDYYEDYLNDWGKQPFVVQGGEFTFWSQLKEGNQNVYRKLFQLRQALNKRIEGHLPGASVDTLNLLAASGITADHESLNGNDVIERLNLGYNVALRYSSIRKDLPRIIYDLKNYPSINLSKLMFTNDGASANFLRDSVQCKMIKIAIDNGMKVEDAYRMATINVATYYRLDHLIGSISPGRLANINIVEDLYEPEPTSVMLDGMWKVVDGEEVNGTNENEKIVHYFTRERKKFQLASIDYNTNIGLKLLNDVITEKYYFDVNSELEENECFITYVNRENLSCVNTRIKGFSKSLTALVSTYSASQDYILIGKDKQRMVALFHEMMNGEEGIYALFEDFEKVKVELPVGGIMSTKSIHELDIELEKFVQKIKESGYRFGDPTYSLLFLTALHLPNLRFSKNGIMDIKTKKILN